MPRARSTKSILASVIGMAIGLVTASTGRAVDFSQLTSLANGALAGQNVEAAVAGFEIRLLQDGELLYHESFGDWAIDTPANIDSSTKTLTGALMVSVAETGDGGFSLDSPVADFLPAFDFPSLDEVTVRQAFSHTSGIEGKSLSLILGSTTIDLQEAASLIALQGLASGPAGAQFDYGGHSMQVAGAAAEAATGTRFIDLLAERITTPLDMNDTRFVIASDDNPRVGGGVESTATDYTRFMDMLLNGGVDRVSSDRVLAADSVVEMLTRQTTDNQPIVDSPVDNNRYGVGVWVDQLAQAGPPVDALAGGARGFHSWIDQSHGLVFTFATDLSSFSNVEVLSSLMHAAILQSLGDANYDGAYTASDYAVWRGAAGPPGAYDAWQSAFAEAPGTAVVALVVPEPASATIVASVWWHAIGCWRLRRRTR